MFDPDSTTPWIEFLGHFKSGHYFSVSLVLHNCVLLLIFLNGFSVVALINYYSANKIGFQTFLLYGHGHIRDINNG